MTTYDEDRADPQMNVGLLDKEFNIDRSINNPIVIDVDSEVIDNQEVIDMRNELKGLEEELPDADQIILDNIERANRILDIIELSISKGSDSARLIEVCGQLINAVTVAATSITGISYNQQVIDNKNRALDIKEKEITVKQLTASKKSENVNITNNLIMTREELLELLENS